MTLCSFAAQSKRWQFIAALYLVIYGLTVSASETEYLQLAQTQNDKLPLQPGQWYIPDNRSALYELNIDCAYELKVQAKNVMILVDEFGQRQGYFMWPLEVQPPPQPSTVSGGLCPPRNLKLLENHILLKKSPFDRQAQTPLGWLALQYSSNAGQAESPLLAQASKPMVVPTTPLPIAPIATNSATGRAIKQGASQEAVGLIAGIELTLGTVAAETLVAYYPAIIATGVIIIAAETVKKILATRADPNTDAIKPPTSEVIVKEMQSYKPIPVTKLAVELSNAGGPGRCKESTYDYLTAKQRKICQKGAENEGESPVCKEGMTEKELEARLLNRWECARVRKEIMDRCFDGGDAGHRKQWENILIQVNTCDLFLSQLRQRVP